MHRGRNRQREPVEIITTTNNSPSKSPITKNGTPPTLSRQQPLKPTIMFLTMPIYTTLFFTFTHLLQAPGIDFSPQKTIPTSHLLKSQICLFFYPSLEQKQTALSSSSPDMFGFFFSRIPSFSLYIHIGCVVCPPRASWPLVLIRENYTDLP